jgi:hypothetical protein
MSTPKGKDKSLIEKLDDLLELDNVAFDLTEPDYLALIDILEKFVDGVTVTDEEVNKVISFIALKEFSQGYDR